MPYYRCPGCGVTAHSAAAFAAQPTCPVCSASLPKAARVYPAPTATRQIRRILAARPQAVAKARHTVRALAVDASARKTLELLVSELVGNSIRHAGLTPQDPVSVHITAGIDRVRVAVRDPGPGFEAPPLDGGDPLVPGGHGYVIVEALSDAWGIDRDADGCTVWCELEVDERPGDAIDREVTDGYVGHLGVEMAAGADASATGPAAPAAR